MPKRIFITVAENSADLHAAQLVAALRAIDPSLMIEAHGGEHLARAGAIIHRNTTRRAAMGLAAVGRVGEMWKLLRWTRDYYRQSPPDLHICCDSWSVNRHFARIARDRGVPVLYYIAPQAWASREGRVKKLRQLVDHLACILPFAEEFFRQRGIPTTFVGHPLFDELPPDRPRPVPRAITDGAPVIGLLPGSRKGIVRANFPRLLAVADQILAQFPKARFMVPTTDATHVTAQSLAHNRSEVTLEQDGFNQIVPQCDLCLTVSGTAALQVAAFGVPMLVVYYGNRILWNLVGRWIVKARTYSLVNILSGRPSHIVPEFIPWYGSTNRVAQSAISLLKDVSLRELQHKALLEMIRPMDHRGASQNVARIAMKLLARSDADGSVPGAGA